MSVMLASSISIRPPSIYAGTAFSCSYAIGEFSSTIREMAPFYFNHVGHVAIGALAGFLAASTIACAKRKNTKGAEPQAVQKAAIIGGTILGAAAIAIPEIPFIVD